MQEFSNFHRYLIAIFSFVLFAAIGFVTAVVLSIYSLWPDNNSIVDALPLMLGFGVIAAILAYHYPRVFSVFLWFMP